MAHHLAQAFRSFEQDIADKAVTDDDIRAAREYLIAFNIANEVNRGLFEQFACGFNQFIAFDVFVTDIEQANARIACGGVLHGRSDQGRTHQSELL